MPNEDVDYVVRRKRYLELPSFTWSEWDSVGLVKQAIRNIEVGQFDAAAMVVDAMTRDDRIDGTLQKRTEAVPALPMEFKPGKGAKAAQIDTALQEHYQAMLPPSAVAELHKWGFMLGLGVGQLVDWDRVINGVVVPRLKVWHPRYVIFRWDTRSFWISTMEGQVELTHGDGQWVLFAPRGLDRAYMMGRVRSLYVPWLIRQWGWRDWARYDEVHGLPIRKAKVPSNAQQSDKDRFLREVTSIGSETVVRLPRDVNGGEETGFDLELLEAQSNNWETFDKLLEAASNCISINILGQNLSTEVKGGSYAAAAEHGAVEASCVKRDAFALEDCFRTGVLKPFAAVNFGAPDSVGIVHYKCEPPEDGKTTADTAKTLGEAVTALTSAGLKVDADALAERLNIPTNGTFEPQATADEKAEQAAKTAKAMPKPELKAIPGGKSAKLSRETGRKRADPAVEGQLYIDDLDDAARQAGERELAPDLEVILECVRRADSYDELHSMLTKAFSDMDPEALAAVFESALLLAELNGRHAIQDEVERETA